MKSWDDEGTKFKDLFNFLTRSISNNENEIDEETLNSTVSKFGRGTFGTYLPMHSNFTSATRPWGIYLFPQFILSRANFLHRKIGNSLGLKQKEIQYAYSYAIYRHLLFHHQVERFSTKHEILTKQVNYKKYRTNVYNKTSNTEGWFEEALAEISVLRSTHISNNINISKKDFNKLYEFDLTFMPPGNQDYHCDNFGGPDEAHKILASQIIQCNINVDPSRSTSICTVNANEFGIPLKKIPIYKVIYDLPISIKSPRQVVEDNY